MTNEMQNFTSEFDKNLLKKFREELQRDKTQKFNS